MVFMNSSVIIDTLNLAGSHVLFRGRVVSLVRKLEKVLKIS